MRNTRKILVALLVVLTLLMSIAVVASATKTTGETTIYLSPNANWKQSNARFALYTWDVTPNWYDMTDTNGDGIYECTIPAGVENIIFCRMNPSATANNWNNKWNQTGDLKYDGSNNHYTVNEGQWDSGTNGSWSLLELGECIHSASDEGTVVSPATCTENGEVSHVCSKCGETFTASILATGHSYAANGECDNCDAVAMFTVAGDNVDLFGTEWDPANTANKLTYDEVTGLWTVSYTNNGTASVWPNYKVCLDGSWNKAWGGAAAGQSNDNAWVEIPAGHTLTISFDYANEKITTSTVAPHTHSWSDATCTEAQKCECGETQGEALGHSYVEGVCSVCGEAEPCNHVYEQNTFYHPELVAATCTTPGVAVFECTLCDYYYTEATPIDSEAHGFWGESEVIAPADCKTETNGLKKVYCANGCGQYEEQTIYYEASHDWDVQKDVQATCTVDGEYYAVCTICSKVEENTYEAQGHYNWYLTCGETGTCMAEGCGVEFTLDHTVDPCEGGYCMNCWSTIEPAHNYVDGKCSACGAEDPDYVAPVDNPLVMDFSKWEAYAEGTYAEGEVQEYNEYFTFIHNSKSRIDGNEKTFADEFVGTQRFNFGGKTSTGSVPSKSALKVTVPSAGTIKVWWVSGGDNRLPVLLDETGAEIAIAPESVKNGLYITEFKIPAAGTYYLGNKDGNNYWFKVELSLSSEPVEPPHVNALVVGDTNKIVVSGNVLNDFGYPIEWVAFTAEDAGYYSFVGDNNAVAYIFGADYSLVSATGAANLEAGTYLICLGNGVVGEFNVAVTKSAWVNALVEGANKIYVDDSINNGADYYVAVVPFTVTEAAKYAFTSTNGLALIYDAEVNNLCGFTGAAELQPGTYYIWVSAYTQLTTGIIDVTLTKTTEGDDPIEPELPALVLGDNTVTIDGSVTNLTGSAIAWLEFVVTEAGTYKVSSADLNCYIYSEMNLASADACLCKWTGIAELEPGTYYVCVGKEGVTGEFTVKVETDVEAPAVNTLVLGENVYVLNQALKDNEAEWLYFTADKDGIYTFSGLSSLEFYIWAAYPNQATVPSTAEFVWNVDALTGELLDSVEVELTAGFYLVGINFEEAEVGEYDITITYAEKPVHEHNFEEGKCECGESDPNYVPPVVDEEPAELNLFQKIIAAIAAFFAKIGEFFKGLFNK